MDGNLACGFAREGLRNTKRHATQMLVQESEAWGRHLAAIGRGGKASMDLAINTIKSSKRSTTNPMFVVELEADRKASSRLVGRASGEFVWAEGYVGDRPEQALIYQMTFLAGSRKTLEYRSKSGGVVIRQHALARCIERADKSFNALSDELAPSIALCTAFKDLDPWVSQPIVLPVVSGLYLGWLGPDFVDDGITYQSACIDATQVENIWLLDPRPTQIELTTFISHSEMFDEQAAIWKALTDLKKAYAGGLLHWHISDLVTLRGKSDPFEFAKSAPDLTPIRAGLRKIVRSSTWKNAVRGPAGVASRPSWGLLELFNRHFLARSSTHSYMAATNSNAWRIDFSHQLTGPSGVDHSTRFNSPT